LIVTLKDLLEAFRQRVDDIETGWEDNDSRLLWSNEEITRYANESVTEYCRRRLLVDKDTAEICQIAVVAGTATYDLDPRIYTLYRLLLDERPLQKTSLYALTHHDPCWESENGAPEYYLESWGVGQWGKITLYPNPVATGTLHLTVARLPLATMSWDDRDAVEPEIPLEDRLALLWWMEFLAYQRQDDDTYNPKRADGAAAAFTMLVGARPSAALELQRKERAGRLMRSHVYY
jgi:hypothetical protein